MKRFDEGDLVLEIRQRIKDVCLYFLLKRTDEKYGDLVGYSCLIFHRESPPYTVNLIPEFNENSVYFDYKIQKVKP